MPSNDPGQMPRLERMDQPFVIGNSGQPFVEQALVRSTIALSCWCVHVLGELLPGFLRARAGGVYLSWDWTASEMLENRKSANTNHRERPHDPFTV